MRLRAARVASGLGFPCGLPEFREDWPGARKKGQKGGACFRWRHLQTTLIRHGTDYTFAGPRFPCVPETLARGAGRMPGAGPDTRRQGRGARTTKDKGVCGRFCCPSLLCRSLLETMTTATHWAPLCRCGPRQPTAAAAAAGRPRARCAPSPARTSRAARESRAMRRGCVRFERGVPFCPCRPQAKNTSQQRGRSRLLDAATPLSRRRQRRPSNGGDTAGRLDIHNVRRGAAMRG